MHAHWLYTELIQGLVELNLMRLLPLKYLSHYKTVLQPKDSGN